jgi:hypothetical protein
MLANREKNSTQNIVSSAKDVSVLRILLIGVGRLRIRAGPATACVDARRGPEYMTV